MTLWFSSSNADVDDGDVVLAIATNLANGFFAILGSFDDDAVLLAVRCLGSSLVRPETNLVADTQTHTNKRQITSRQGRKVSQSLRSVPPVVLLFLLLYVE